MTSSHAASQVPRFQITCFINFIWLEISLSLSYPRFNKQVFPRFNPASHWQSSFNRSPSPFACTQKTSSPKLIKKLSFHIPASQLAECQNRNWGEKRLEGLGGLHVRAKPRWKGSCHSHVHTHKCGPHRCWWGEIKGLKTAVITLSQSGRWISSIAPVKAAILLS